MTQPPSEFHALTQAQTLAAPFPALLAQARALAATLVLGDHGRRRAGSGDAFWQFRPALAGDSLRAIDWRRSARADDQFVRETEWQSAQTVQVWVDGAASMGFASGDVSKFTRAQVLALALSILLTDAGERVGTANAAIPPQTGRGQVDRLAAHFQTPAHAPDFGAPDATALAPNANVLFVSDFLGDFAKVEHAVTQAADRRARGVLLMILDPQEVAFPFHGRAIFESMGGTLLHETQKADDLRAKYQAALEARKTDLRALARQVGWQMHLHTTDNPAQSALLWLHQAIGGLR